MIDPSTSLTTQDPGQDPNFFQDFLSSFLELKENKKCYFGSFEIEKKNGKREDKSFNALHALKVEKNDDLSPRQRERIFVQSLIALKTLNTYIKSVDIENLEGLSIATLKTLFHYHGKYLKEIKLPKGLINVRLVNTISEILQYGVFNDCCKFIPWNEICEDNEDSIEFNCDTRINISDEAIPFLIKNLLKKHKNIREIKITSYIEISKKIVSSLVEAYPKIQFIKIYNTCERCEPNDSYEVFLTGVDENVLYYFTYKNWYLWLNVKNHHLLGPKGLKSDFSIEDLDKALNSFKEKNTLKTLDLRWFGSLPIEKLKKIASDFPKANIIGKPVPSDLPQNQLQLAQDGISFLSEGSLWFLRDSTLKKKSDYFKSYFANQDKMQKQPRMIALSETEECVYVSVKNRKQFLDYLVGIGKPSLSLEVIENLLPLIDFYRITKLLTSWDIYLTKSCAENKEWKNKIAMYKIVNDYHLPCFRKVVLTRTIPELRQALRSYNQKYTSLLKTNLQGFPAYLSLEKEDLKNDHITRGIQTILPKLNKLTVPWTKETAEFLNNLKGDHAPQKVAITLDDYDNLPTPEQLTNFNIKTIDRIKWHEKKTAPFLNSLKSEQNLPPNIELMDVTYGKLPTAEKLKKWKVKGLEVEVTNHERAKQIGNLLKNCPTANQLSLLDVVSTDLLSTLLRYFDLKDQICLDVHLSRPSNESNLYRILKTLSSNKGRFKSHHLFFNGKLLHWHWNVGWLDNMLMNERRQEIENILAQIK